MTENRSATKSDLLWILAARAVLLFFGWSQVRLGFIGSDRGHPLGGIAYNLRVLEAVKEQYALEHRATNGTPVTAADLAHT